VLNPYRVVASRYFRGLSPKYLGYVIYMFVFYWMIIIIYIYIKTVQY
jgi:hypothetical protein